MSNRKLAAALILATGMFGGALFSCAGDDTVGALPDAGKRDATAGGFDASATSPDAGDDGGGGGCEVFDAGPLDDAAVALGRQVVQQRKCQQCHGQLLSGNKNGVPGANGGVAYPPNLTSDPTTGLGCWTNAEIERAILHGIDNEGRQLCPPMPVFADAGLDDASAAAVVAFLRSLPVTVNQVPDTECSGAADGGSEGGATDGGHDAGAGDASADASADAGDAAAADSGADANADSSADAGTDGSAADAAND